MSSRTDRLVRHAVEMSQRGATEHERESWRARAEELADKYGLTKLMDSLISGEGIETFQQSGHIEVSDDTLYLSKDDIEWAPTLASFIAEGFDCVAVSRKWTSGDEVVVALADSESFLYFDVLGSASDVAAATELAVAVVDLAYELWNDGFVVEDTIGPFVMELSRQLRGSVQNRRELIAAPDDSATETLNGSTGTGTGTALAVYSKASKEAINKEIERRYPQRKEVTVAVAQVSDETKAEVYLARKKLMNAGKV